MWPAIHTPARASGRENAQREIPARRLAELDEPWRESVYAIDRLELTTEHPEPGLPLSFPVLVQ